ncbi:hypothetical protein [Ferrimonas aestuarii]|uniref:Colicin V production protein n=1 Tax=Ferrimonas aestuarii TaxID=2569539 RepID=A0A4V5NVX6_9GAMM|nr:hypothetical protein [Ferrimonas aestuarii]TKB53296.1 hypothetical protein FCL42_14585 [Ferrimonas aestuarii]
MRLLVFAFTLMAWPALAADVTLDTVVDLITVLGGLFGSKGAAIAATITTVLLALSGLWSQIRPSIPNDWMAKLHPWLLWFFDDVLGGNRGSAANDSVTGPQAIKQRSLE